MIIAIDDDSFESIESDSLMGEKLVALLEFLVGCKHSVDLTHPVEI